MESQGLLTWWEDRSARSLARRLEVLQLTDVLMSFDIGDIGQLVTLRSVLDWITNRASGGDGGILTLPPQRRATCRRLCYRGRLHGRYLGQPIVHSG